MAVEPFPVCPENPGTGEHPPVTRIRTDELVRTVVVARPLDDVVQLVTLLEQSPDGLPIAASVLRVAAVARSAEDVSRLVELLGPPHRGVDRMDEVIRSTAEQRPVAEVGRLVALLHAAPHSAHAKAQDDNEVHDRDPESASTPAPVPAPAPSPAHTAPQGEEQSARLWLRRAAAVLVLLCGAVHFPLDWVDAPRRGLAASLGVSVLCLLAGTALWFSRSSVVAVAAVLVAGAPAAAQLLGAHADSAVLAYVRQAGGAATPLPALAACLATLAALAALAVPLAGRGRATGARDTAPDAALEVNSLRL